MRDQSNLRLVLMYMNYHTQYKQDNYTLHQKNQNTYMPGFPCIVGEVAVEVDMPVNNLIYHYIVMMRDQSNLHLIVMYMIHHTQYKQDNYTLNP